MATPQAPVRTDAPLSPPFDQRLSKAIRGFQWEAQYPRPARVIPIVASDPCPPSALAKLHRPPRFSGENLYLIVNRAHLQRKHKRRDRAQDRSKRSGGLICPSTHITSPAPHGRAPPPRGVA